MVCDANRLTLLKDKKEIAKKLLSVLIKPFVTADWWGKTLELIEKITNEVPCYELEFDESGEVVELLKEAR